MPENIASQGMLLILSGPSGVGKGSLTQLLLQREPSFRLSCSATTRRPREGEINGVHYHFISEERYDELLAEDAFLEHASVHGHRYGTLKSAVEEILNQGESVILEIDQQGALQVMAHAEHYVSVFVLPPSFEELKRRLLGRKSETEEDVRCRLENARGEMEKLPAYQYAIINDDLEEAYAALSAIVQAERHRTLRYHPIIAD